VTNSSFFQNLSLRLTFFKRTLEPEEGTVENGKSNAGSALRQAGAVAANSEGFLVNLFGGVWQVLLVGISIAILVLTVSISVIKCVTKGSSGRFACQATR